VKFDSKEFY